MGYTAEELRTIDYALASKYVEELKILARSYYVRGSAKMRKQELIAVVKQAMLEPGRMAELIYMMSDKVWRDFQKVCQCGSCRRRNWISTASSAFLTWAIFSRSMRGKDSK